VKNLLIAPIYILFAMLLIFGNAVYSNENYSMAGKVYRLMQLYPFELSEKALFNSGNAVYRQEEYKNAEKIYLKIINNTKDEELKANTFYNLGNVYFKIGEQKLKVTAVEVRKYWLMAIDEYEKDLVLNPDDTQAKENIEFIKELLKMLDEAAGKQGDSGDKESKTQKSKVSKSDVQNIEEKEKENRKQQKGRRSYEEGYKKRDYDLPYW